MEFYAVLTTVVIYVIAWILGYLTGTMRQRQKCDYKRRDHFKAPLHYFYPKTPIKRKKRA